MDAEETRLKMCAHVMANRSKEESEYWAKKAEQREKEKAKEEKRLKPFKQRLDAEYIVDAYTVAVGGTLRRDHAAVVKSKTVPKQSEPTKYNEIAALKHLAKAQELAVNFIELSHEGNTQSANKYYRDTQKEAVKAFVALEKCPEFRPQALKILGEALDPSEIAKERDAGRGR